MAKRIADKELTDRNWDQEEEGEEAGTFSVASKDVLKSREIKKAKRRNTGGEVEGGGAFKGFKGFSSAAAAPTVFSGFGNPGGFKGLGALTNGSSTPPSFGGFSSPATSTPAAGVTSNGPSPTQQTNGSAPSPSQSPCSNSKEYSRQLTALNCSVRDWITKHVNDNPLCDLNPIFKDYERHLSSIERQYGSGAADGGSEKQQGETAAAPPAPPSSSSSSSGSAAPSAAFFSFSKHASEDSAQKSSSVAATFNFGQKVDPSVLGSLGAKPAAPSFSFSTSSTAASTTSLFGAPGGTTAAPLSFSGAKTVDAQAADENGEEESEEPPKPEVKEVKEDDAFYSKKCRLFYKKESEYKEKGVGTLHLKNTAEGKTQMIIRAETSLGNILLNIIVSPSMPCTRLGKNNVMVICVPNPPVDDKNPSSPVTFLIRVKTSEDADELQKILEEKKG